MKAYKKYKVCRQCIVDLQDMRYKDEGGYEELIFKKDNRIAKCPYIPRCFDQPERSKREDGEKHCDNCLCSCGCGTFEMARKHADYCDLNPMRCSEHCRNAVREAQ